jgi:hypothetical protein
MKTIFALFVATCFFGITFAQQAIQSPRQVRILQHPKTP